MLLAAAIALIIIYLVISSSTSSITFLTIVESYDTSTSQGSVSNTVSIMTCCCFPLLFMGLLMMMPMYVIVRYCWMMYCHYCLSDVIVTGSMARHVVEVETMTLTATMEL